MRTKKIPVQLNDEEFGILEEVVLLEPFLLDVIGSAKIKGGLYTVKFQSDNIEDVINALSYAGYSMFSYPKNEAALKLREKLEGFFLLNKALEK